MFNDRASPLLGRVILAVNTARLGAGLYDVEASPDGTASPLDLDGNARVNVPGVGRGGALADVGAYEYQAP